MQLASVDLNLLVALDALLAERNVSRAAERLMVGQPAMSSTLGRLRSLFNDPLLVREGRVLRATAFAESLVEPVRAVLAQIEAIVNVGTAFDPLTDHRIFSIMASDYVALVLLRPLLERLPALAPNVQIHVRPLETVPVDSVRRNQTDLLIMPRELMPSHLDLPFEELFTDRFVCVVDKDNPVVGAELDREQFSELPYLQLNQGLMTSIIETRLDELGVVRNIEMVAQSFVMAPFLLPGTRLVAIVHERFARELMSDGHFRILQPPFELATIGEGMVWAPRQTADAGHRWLRGQLAELARDI
ncbi:LysR family transcriptional regulator [Subtercola lobariae]|uniref:LysR family transcriptional regulator n=1 Tax=Subtercola lobariae TaxID=1588641 RepID=A0A917B823_9MICO|nr:LysR family transcriptional regulator [Subtercola lobariae]GGF30497.1 LysR family transcriptional regulator [Subtercola lobariae]